MVPPITASAAISRAARPPISLKDDAGHLVQIANDSTSRRALKVGCRTWPARAGRAALGLQPLRRASLRGNAR
jgi:hypothetical protein